MQGNQQEILHREFVYNNIEARIHLLYPHMLLFILPVLPISYKFGDNFP